MINLSDFFNTITTTGIIAIVALLWNMDRRLTRLETLFKDWTNDNGC